jgi:hypothetical protein
MLTKNPVLITVILAREDNPSDLCAAVGFSQIGIPTEELRNHFAVEGVNAAKAKSPAYPVVNSVLFTELLIDGVFHCTGKLFAIDGDKLPTSVNP